MRQQWTYDEFTKALIAKGNDPDACYDNCGWLAVVDGNDAALASFGHCSCDDTWGAITDGYSDVRRITFVWEGTVGELVGMAMVKADPAMPMRTADPGDSDYRQLLDCYAQVLTWAEGRRYE